LEKIEKMLAIWVEDQNKKKMTVNSHVIRTKALKLYEHLRQGHRDASSAEPFAASKGDTSRSCCCMWNTHADPVK
jgi:hypothetical protein